MKKKINDDETLPPIQKIAVEIQENQPVKPVLPSVSSSNLTHTKNQPASSVSTNNTTSKAETNKPSRPVSISITPSTKPQQQTEENTVVNVAEKISLDEQYSAENFEKAWKSYVTKIPGIVSAVSYINNNIPLSVENHTYELKFTNIFQEKEFKKLQQDIQLYLRTELKNSNIVFQTVIEEVSGNYKSNNPEEIYKKMAEENPAIHILKTNLNLEID